MWGAWSSNDRLRTGLELTMSPSSVGTGTSSVTVTAKRYMQTRYASSESGTGSTPWDMTGDIVGNGTANGWDLPAMGTKLLGTVSKTFTTSYTSTVSVDVAGGFQSTYAYPGTSAYSSASLTIPKRPYSPPAAPSGVTLTRGSGESLTLSWTRNATTAAPYSSIEIQWANTKDSGYYAGGSASGSATSFASTGMVDRGYRGRVRAVNSAGASAWVESNLQYTTPATPPSPTATKNAAGDIVVVLPTPAAGSSAINYEVWHAADGVWDAARLALVASSSGSWTHASPDPAKTHAYRLRGASTTPLLYSGYSGTSATVQLIAPPNAPSSLSPNGAVRDAVTNAITLTYRHNAVDSTPQRQVQARYRAAGGAWDERAISVKSTENWIITAGWWANGVVEEWQVRTWGAATTGGSDGTGASPWSATATVTLSTTPTVAINAPTATLTTSILTATWGYNQAEGKAQAAWRAKLLDSAGSVIESLPGSGAASSATFKTVLTGDTNYSVTVQVQSSAGLWSTVASQSFLTDFPGPPAADVTPWWQPDTGAVALDIDVPSPGGTEPAATKVQVYRANGDAWALVADTTPGVAVTDFIPPLGSLVTYKVVTVSDLPSSTAVTVDVLTDGAPGPFINGGAGYAQAVRLISNVVVDVSGGRAKGVHTYRGGRRVEWTGQARSRVLGVRTDLWAEWTQAQALGLASTWDEIWDLADLPGPHCYRDPDGRRYFVSLTDPSISGLGASAKRGVALTLTEVDWIEPIGPDQ